jgi:sugar O-acyltransferase (sialic acid O-acetyltransferase NeuD family)
MHKNKKLIIVGDSAFAEIAYEYFTYDSPYEVLGFAVESAYRTKTELFGLPVIAFEDVESRYNPNNVEFYAALVYTQLNHLRTRLYREAKAKGFRPASYISSRAFVWRNVDIGEHCFIFEDNTIQPFVKIGSNVVMWSGNHIGHHTVIGDNCFLASHAVVSGFCTIGNNVFMGVNCTIGNNIVVAENNCIGAGACIVRSTEPDQLYKGVHSKPTEASARSFFKVPGA